MSQLKPQLTEDEKRLLKKKNELARKRVEFHRQEWHRYKKLGDSWRKPRGKHSKLREHIDTRIPVVDSGFRGPKLVRGLHPSGFREVLVHTPKDLESIDSSKYAARIGSTVGSRKRELIEKRAQELNIRILNPEVK